MAEDLKICLTLAIVLMSANKTAWNATSLLIYLFQSTSAMPSTEPPQVMFGDSDLRAQPGYTLSCSSTGSPPIYTALMINSTVLVNTTNTASIRVYRGGNYTCMATSKYGRDFKEISVSLVASFPNCLLPNKREVRQIGIPWLSNSTTKCSCNRSLRAECVTLDKPECTDIRGTIRTNGEEWTNSSCVQCTCVNGTVRCNKYEVLNVTYGLFKVDEVVTCEQCDHDPFQTPEAATFCDAFLRDNLFQCFTRSFFIRGNHSCNGVIECPDGSDEMGCEDVLCRDEDGNTFIIKDNNGWQASPCVRCHCIKGTISCQRTIPVFFPGYPWGAYRLVETCTQPSCNVLHFIRNKGRTCEAIEIIKNKGILMKGQTYNNSGCDLYFPGSTNDARCPLIARGACYVFNGGVCCSSDCPALSVLGTQMRGKLTYCPNGRQLAARASDCGTSVPRCWRGYDNQNCSLEFTCKDEDSNKYFEGATWSVGSCIHCECLGGKISCRKEIYGFPSREILTKKFCSQPTCNVANFVKTHEEECLACRWRGQMYYDGDHWKENGVDFYCSSSEEIVRPGCYVKENGGAKCIGAIPGIRDLSKISNESLFLCENGYEIRSLNDRCNIRPDCADQSDERNCRQYYCSASTEFNAHWERTQINQEIFKNCSLVDSAWEGTFGRKCLHLKWKTEWSEKTRCRCEKRTIANYFRLKFAEVNESNLLNISTELSSSAGYFINKRIFHEMFTDLFDVATKLFTPITPLNSQLALIYVEHVIGTVLRTNIYEQGVFGRGFCSEAACSEQLVDERYHLAHRAVDFLRQWGFDVQDIEGLLTIKIHRTCPYIVNFAEAVLSDHKISSQQLWLEVTLNTAALIPSVEDQELSRDGHLDITLNGTGHHNIQTVEDQGLSHDGHLNITTLNGTGHHNTQTVKVQELSRDGHLNIITLNGTGHHNITNKQMKAILESKGCTRVSFDKSGNLIIKDPAATKSVLTHQEIQIKMENVLLCTSVGAIIIYLIMLSLIRIKKTERIFVHINLLLSLGLGNLVYVLDKTVFTNKTDLPVLCTIVAVVQHYLHTAVFTWMLVEGIILYTKLVKVFSVKKQYLAYTAVGWGIPVMIIGVVASIRPSSYDMGLPLRKDVMCGSLKFTSELKRTRCWLNGSLWIYKGPILFFLLVNIGLFVILLRVILGKLAQRYSQEKIKFARKGLKSIGALLPLLGVSWLLGFFIEFHIALGYMYIVLNCTQGIFFTIFHCFFDDQVREGLKKLRAKHNEVPKTNGLQTPAKKHLKSATVDLPL